MRKQMLAGVMLVLIGLVSGCGGGGGRSSSTASNSSAGSTKPYEELRWGEPTFPGRINYYDNIQLPGDLSIESLVVDTLVELEPSGLVKKSGYLATNEQRNSTTYVYHLKPGVKFSDGSPLTTADVIFSLEQHIVGKESAWATYWQDVSSIQAEGKSTVVIKLKRPEAVWPQVMGFNSQIIQKAQAERVGEKALGTPGHLLIGTGPWKFDEYKPEASITLSRNPYWSGSRQPAAKITVTLFKNEASEALALRNGAIDGTFDYVTPKSFVNISGVKQLTSPGTNITLVGVNTTQPPFNDVHVRRAIAYATDAEGMIKALFPAGDASEDTSIVPPVLFSDLGSSAEQKEIIASLPSYRFDLAAARHELAKSAYPHGFTTTVEANNAFANEDLVAQVLASDLAKIGIHAKVDEFPPSNEPEFIGRKITIEISEYLPGYIDPEGMMQFLLFPNPSPQAVPLNYAYYSNPEVLRLMHQNLEDSSARTRLQLLGKALRIVGADAPYRPIYTHKTFGSLSEKYVFPTFSVWTMFLRPWALGIKLAE